MKHLLLLIQLCIVSVLSIAQTGQLGISRVDLMPNLPAPLQIRDWNAVAVNYDNYIFNFNKTGQYLPLSKLGTQGQFNYADNIPLFLDSYVGTNSHLNQAEAINIIPALVGASLAGIDKSNQNGVNWVAKAKDFFNLKNGQNVYLNSYSTHSGNDWWYDVMPNVFFYQLRFLYPAAAPEFNAQFSTVADRWLTCVRQLGGSATPWSVPDMNHRAFNLATGLPLDESVPEPESAGSIAWLLYNAYLETGNRKYIEGARQAMDFLGNFGSNPAYELQLSYGTMTAARMNAVERTNYPIQKMLCWCFDRGALRGWGSIVGTWGGYDVSGLIGEANDAGDDYAFVMNGFQQAAALAPLPKYDKRFARPIAKWLLNVTNASRLFYWNAIPQANQDSYAWASANDPEACIPHESMKQISQGKSPFVTGDAIGGGWAATNLSLYSGSGVGYLAAVVKTTNIPEILQIDLNKTDFYGENALPSYLYYNPTSATKLVNVALPTGTFSVYEAITETVINSSASSTIQVSVPAGEVRMIRLFATGITPENRNGILYAGADILDYHFQYQYSDKLRVKALSTDKNPVVLSTSFTAFCEPENINSGDQVQYEWYIDNVLVEGQSLKQATLTAPSHTGQFTLKCKISFNGQSAEDTLQLSCIDHISNPPVVNGIQSNSNYAVINSSNPLSAIVVPAPGEILQYEWTATAGVLNLPSGTSITWQAPDKPVVATITVKVTNQDNLSTTFSTTELVKDTSLAIQTPLIWYPFDFDNLNAASERFPATVSGAIETDDARGLSSLAYKFTSGQNIIATENQAELNFGTAVSLSCWVKCTELGSERFIISHGSWQQRYKLSITPEGKLRWTVKTSTGVADLDGSAPIELNRYYHVTVLYTGFSMELYVDGLLDTFKTFSGTIQTSTKPLTIGRMDNVETLYALRGSVDEVKLWDKEIPIKQIANLKNQWNTSAGISENEIFTSIYPNPAEKLIYVEFKDGIYARQVSIYNSDGKRISDYQVKSHEPRLEIQILQPSAGMYLLRLVLNDGTMVSRKIISK